MPADRWKQIEVLFEQAIEQPPHERSDWLNEHCDDEDLRAEVEALLAAHERPSGILDRPLPAWSADEEEDVRERRVGPYRLVEEIGRGGMGVVYRAERADGHFEQQVAVKLLRWEWATEDRARRFRSERQILASLQHPNIARLYDGGVTEEGLPFLVMEYVEGRPIDAYCEAHHCSFEERLTLVLTVARAVEHAHQRLVIHRDLKPSNILVTGAGDPKLLDFGLAKLLREEPAEETPSTRPTRRWMTLQYASPEQVKGEPLTTASDTYQLGLVLYELLTGQRPYDVTDKTPSEAERVICETEPTRPSTAATGATDPSETRFAPPAHPRQKLKGDLDTIILKALRKDPERGYASAETLADDLERHRQGLPVSARPDTLGYRAKKFVQRHRGGVVAAALVLLSLLAGIAGTTWQAQRATQQARRAEAERDKARQVTAFLVDVFEVADPSRTKGDTVTARELLDEGAARVRNELDDQPDVQAALLNAVGRVYRQIGLYDDARPLLEDALALRRNRFETPHPDVAASLHELGVLRQQQGEYGWADTLLTDALAMRRTLVDAPHADLAVSLTRLGQVKRQRRHLDRAERLLRDALSMHRSLYGDTHPHVANGQFDLAMTLHDRGRYRDAQGLLQQAAATYRALPGEATPEHATALYTLAEFEEGAVAESLHREALQMRRALYGPKHPEVAASLSGLAGTLKGRGRLDDAEKRLREALSIQRTWHGGDAGGEAQSLLLLGHVLDDQGDVEAAEASFREALALQRGLRGDAHPNVGMVLNALADLLRNRDDLSAADSLYRQVLAIYRQSYGEDHLMTLRIRTDRAVLFRERGDCARAVPTFREALRRYRTLFSGAHPRLAETAFQLGACFTALERYDEAERHLLESRRMGEQLDASEDHRRTVLRHLVRLYEAWGNPDRAAKYRALLANARATATP